MRLTPYVSDLEEANVGERKRAETQKGNSGASNYICIIVPKNTYLNKYHEPKNFLQDRGTLLYFD